MALDELAATAFYVHDYRTGFAACEALLKQSRLPEGEVERNQKNHAAYLERLQQIEASTTAVMPTQTPQSVRVVSTAPQSLLNTGAVQKIKSFKKRRK